MKQSQYRKPHLGSSDSTSKYQFLSWFTFNWLLLLNFHHFLRNQTRDMKHLPLHGRPKRAWRGRVGAAALDSAAEEEAEEEHRLILRLRIGRLVVSSGFWLPSITAFRIGKAAVWIVLSLFSFSRKLHKSQLKFF